MAEEKTKEWEQAWPPEKIRQQSEKWNLAGDAGLMLCLRQASDDLMMRIEKSKKNLGELTDNAQKVAFVLDGTINDFSQLANNQFIENRVYDDDVKSNRDQKPAPEIAKSKEEREAEVVAVMKAALQKGCTLMDSHFTKIDVRPLDFDEEDDPTFTPQPVFEPKDPYGTRTLPYIIATPNFMKSDYVGLLEDEEETAKNKKQESFTDSDDDTTPESSKIQVEQATAKEHSRMPSPVPSAAQPIFVAVSPSMAGKTASDSSSGLFGTSADSREGLFPDAESNAKRDASVKNTAQTEQSIPPSDFRSELTKRLVSSVPTSPETPIEKAAPVPSVTAGPISHLSHGDNDEALLPPPLPPAQKNASDSDDEDGLFKPYSRGLFDDDDEKVNKPAPLPRGRLQQLAEPEAASVPTVVKASVTNQETKTIARPSAITKVEQSKPDIFNEPKALAVPTSLPFGAAAKGAGSSLFNTGDSDDDDLFGVVYKKEPISIPRQSPMQNQTSSNKPVDKPAMTSSQPLKPPVARRSGASLFDDEEDEDDLFSVVNRRSQLAQDQLFSLPPTLSKKEQSSSVEAPPAMADNGDSNAVDARDVSQADAPLRIDHDEKTNKPAPVPRTRHKQSDEAGPIAAAPTSGSQETVVERAEPTLSTLTTDQPVTAAQPHLRPAIGEVSVAKSKGSSLFNAGDSDDDDLFGKAYKKETVSASRIPPSPSQTNSSTNTSKPAAVPQPVNRTVPKRTGASLFDDDEDDLFSTNEKAREQSKPKDDIVSGGTFGGNKKPEAVPASTLQPRTASIQKGKSLFDDDDDVDIFQ